MPRKKVTIVGAGRVGSTTAQLLAYKDICDIVLLNRTPETAMGIVLDIKESAPIEGFDCNIKGTGDYADIRDSDIIIITAGAQRKEGQSRDELLKINADVMRPICEKVKKLSPNAVVIVLTNPLDQMVYLAKQLTGFPKQRVIGMAGILDTSRYKEFLSMALGTSVNDISAMVLGSHGDLMVPLPRFTTVAGVPVTDLLTADKIQNVIEHTKNAGAEIIKLEKSSAFYAPASALALMAESILADSKRMLPCSVYLDGEYGIRGVFLGVPIVLGAKGAEKIIELKLDKGEKEALKKAAGAISAMVKQLV